jgi:molybdopterin-guanine dinucleotide biosynthesis protein A
MGIPKAQLKVGDNPILSWLLARWMWEGPKLLVTAPGREHPPGCEGFDREAVDAVIDQGPMRGVVTALDAAETEIIVVATCDMPLVERQQLIWLAEQLDDPCACGLFVQRSINGAWRIEPFPCVLRKSAAELMKPRLADGDSAMHALTDLPQFPLLAAPGEWSVETWLNLNRREDLEALERVLS